MFDGCLHGRFESVVKPEDPQTRLIWMTFPDSFESVVKPEDPQTQPKVGLLAR